MPELEPSRLEENPARGCAIATALTLLILLVFAAILWASLPPSEV